MNEISLKSLIHLYETLHRQKKIRTFGAAYNRMVALKNMYLTRRDNV